MPDLIKAHYIETLLFLYALGATICFAWKGQTEVIALAGASITGLAAFAQQGIRLKKYE